MNHDTQRVRGGGDYWAYCRKRGGSSGGEGGGTDCLLHVDFPAVFCQLGKNTRVKRRAFFKRTYFYKGATPSRTQWGGRGGD